MQQLMQDIFDGYVYCYRKFCWHTTSNYSDITQTELSYFSNLGEMLGYQARREMNWCYPRDLCWVKPNSETPFMYMERENKDERCEHTIEKMLNQKNSKDIPLLIANFGWLKPKSYQWAHSQFQNRSNKNQAVLLFAWVGATQDDDNFIVKASTFSGNKIMEKEAIPSIDAGGFWQINYQKNTNWK